MWIVQLALRRPYTFFVLGLVIIALGVLAIVRMPIVTIRCERAFTTNVNDIEHIESQSLPGLAIIKVFFHRNAKIEAGVAQISASSQSVLHSQPTRMTPLAVIRYNASSVRILQFCISSDSMSEQALYDYSYNFVRTQMATVQGASFPTPYGGKPRQIMVDLNPPALYAQGLSPTDVVNAINAQSLIIPSGEVRIGARDYAVKLNSLPEAVSGFDEVKRLGS